MFDFKNTQDVLLFIIFGADGLAVIMIRVLMAFFFSYLLVKIYVIIEQRRGSTDARK